MLNNIEAINIIFENGDNIIINASDFKDFCITNLDDNGNEIPYEQTIIKNKLYANFVLLSMKSNLKDSNKFKRLKARQDITEIMVIFKNQKYIKFVVPSNADPFVNSYHNDYEYIYEDGNNLGLLLSKYNIKYKNNLFI
jgi:hypothetical protein